MKSKKAKFNEDMLKGLLLVVGEQIKSASEEMTREEFISEFAKGIYLDGPLAAQLLISLLAFELYTTKKDYEDLKNKLETSLSA